MLFPLYCFIHSHAGTAALAGIIAAMCKFMRCERHCANGLHIIWVCGMQDTGDAPSPVQSSPPLAIMQLLAMLFPEWSVAFNAVQILTAMFYPTLDPNDTIVCVEGEILTAANVDSLVTVDGGFNYLNT